jgi:hypothetical protein
MRLAHALMLLSPFLILATISTDAQPTNKAALPTNRAPASSSPVGAPVHKPKFAPIAKPFEVTGEVVDTWCFASQTMGPGRGERHKACGTACVLGGVTAGIVDDQGNLYIAAKHQGYTGCNQLLLPYMAKRVKAVGWMASKGGCNIMKIRSVQEVK